MSKMKFLLVAFCLIALGTSQLTTCDETATKLAQDELQMRHELDSLPKPINWFDLGQVRDVLMELIKDIKRSWEVRKASKYIDQSNIQSELKLVVVDELKRFKTDLQLRQRHRELSQKLLERMDLIEGKNNGQKLGRKIASSFNNFRNENARFTDEKGVERSMHEMLMMSSDLTSTSDQAQADPFDGMTEEQLREMMKDSFIDYSKFVEGHNEKLKRERISLIKKKTEIFFGDLLKTDFKDLAMILVQEVAASKKLDLKSGAAKVIFERVLKNLAWFICDILTDMLALIIGREAIPNAPAIGVLKTV